MLYDISRMKQAAFTEDDVPAAVFDLYLNFINIFLDILRILSFFTSKD
jgi:FtsH-binding integral membrane protein